MTRRRPITLIVGAAAAALAALAIAACGGGGGATAATAPATTGTGSGATIGTASTGLGTVLVDSQGRTLYRFLKDTGSTSMCSGECTSDWPPLQANGKPTAGGGAKASMLGTTKRSDGTTQVTYNGHPLYTFSGDAKPGDTNGEGLNEFGGRWYAVSSSGDSVVSQSTTSSNSGGGGFSY